MLSTPTGREATISMAEPISSPAHKLNIVMSSSEFNTFVGSCIKHYVKTGVIVAKEQKGLTLTISRLQSDNIPMFYMKTIS